MKTKNSKALIGWTGFVGGSLCEQHGFDAIFNSETVVQARGQNFDTVVCAAAPGSMMLANKFPERDAEQIEALCQELNQIEARRFILISSIAVLDDFAGRYNETDACYQTEIAYGRHRRNLESFCAERFPACHIIRLPALYGEGLKKNFIFDLMNPVPTMLTEEKMSHVLDVLPAALTCPISQIFDLKPEAGMHVVDRAKLSKLRPRAELEAALIENGLSSMQFTNPNSSFQFYDMRRLWSDISMAVSHNLNCLHLGTEPQLASVIFEAVKGKKMPSSTARLHAEDMRTKYAALWGRDGFYIEDAAVTRKDIAEFVTAGGVRE